MPRTVQAYTIAEIYKLAHNYIHAITKGIGEVENISIAVGEKETEILVDFKRGGVECSASLPLPGPKA